MTGASDLAPWLLLGIGFAFSQVALGLGLITTLRPFRLEHLFYTGFLIAVGAYLLDPLFAGPWIDLILASLTVFVPGMFFLFSASLFDDSFSLQRWHFVLVGLTVIPPIIGQLLAQFGHPGPDLWLFTIPQLLEFPLLGLALYLAVRFWSPDLVLQRRRLRLWFSGFAGVYILLLILLRETLLRDDPALASLQFLPACALLFATNMQLLRYRRSIWGRSDPVAPGPVRPARDAENGPMSAAEAPPDAPSPVELSPVVVEDLAVVNRLMEDEFAYREMGLTLADLARRAEVPVYRLRQAINEGLGYRNFNDFLNSYRIREAAQRLTDPQQADTQVLVIALDAGFRSLSTFNKAFRRAFDQTPTEYRRQALES